MHKIAVVTGSSGFVGKALVKSLQEQGYQTICPTHTDCNNEISLKNFFEEKVDNNSIDIVYMIGWAGVAVPSQRNDVNVQFQNVLSILNLLNSLKNYKVRKIVFGGSGTEFEYFFSFGDKSKLPPVTCYGASKTYADTLVRYYCEQNNISFSSAYINNIYGPGEISDKLICSSIKKLFRNDHINFSSGEQLYDFAYIDDVIVDLITLSDEKYNGSFLLGSGKTIPLKDFLHDLCDVFGKDSEEYRTFGTQGGASIDLDKLPYKVEYISNVANLKRTNFKEGIRKTAQFLIDEGVITNE